MPARTRLFALLAATALVTPAFAETTPAAKDAAQQKSLLPPLQVTITDGISATPARLPGSGARIDAKTLQQTNTTDPLRVLRRVPGVNVQEEDGFGLRPNIGLRGSRIDRSADITLMEDGVLIAPAPYAAPAAYYFPRIERMQGIEVLKGTSSIKYGPRTTSGAVNLLSSDVPDYFTGRAQAGVGSYGGLRSAVNVGTTVENWGFVADHTVTTSDGFKDIDFSGGETGFLAQDSMLKVRYRTDADAAYYQEIELKGVYGDQQSDETYLGLTNGDFLHDPYRRYAGSQQDEMESHYSQFQFTHYIEPKRGMSLTTTAYRNTVDRNWYRLAEVTAGGSTVGITGVLNTPAAFSSHLAVLRGDVDSADDALRVNSNDRTYLSTGLQTALAWNTTLGGVAHALEMGLRYHTDEEDRFQRQDRYRITDGVMALTTRGTPGTQANQVLSADAWAGYVLDRITLGKLAVTPGVRYEYVSLRNENFGTADPGRTGSALRHFESTVTALTPGLAADYALTDAWTVLGGVHRGFAPPAPPGNAAAAENAEAEKSTAYEAGVRYTTPQLQGSVIGFFTDYENLLGRDTFSSGGSGAIEQFNGGAVEVYGIEASIGTDLGKLWPTVSVPQDLRFPLGVSYTYTKTAFQNDFVSSFGEWGTVTAGDELPYVPRHQMFVSVGVEAPEWLVNVGVRYTDAVRTVAGQGDLLPTASTDASVVVDANAEYAIVENLRLFVSANNLFDEEYIASRRPSGVRPGAPQVVFAGVKVAF